MMSRDAVTLIVSSELRGRCRSSRLGRGAFVLSCQPCPHALDRDGSRWIGLQRVIGRAPLLVQTSLDGAIASEQCPQSVADYFAFGRVLAGRDFGFHGLRHFSRKGDAELLCGAHDRLTAWIVRRIDASANR